MWSPLRAVKARVRNAYYRLKARNIVPAAHPGSGPPIVVGLLRTPIGMGEFARLNLAALRALGFPVGPFDVSHLFRRESVNVIKIDSEDSRAFEELGPLLLHVKPPEFDRTLALLGRQKTAGRLLIGCWVWELERIPPSWRSALHQLHEVWAPSRFCAEAIRSETKKPVFVVPCPVRPYEGEAWDRRALKIPDETFVVLCTYDMRSSQARKNPIGAVRAFRRAFGDSPAAVLLVKVTDPEFRPDSFNELKSEIQTAANIRLLVERLSAEEMGALIAGVDAVLSLHRSEGIGLVPAQAMLAAKPVVATAWSGNMDFMDAESAALVPYELVPVRDPQGIYDGHDQVWAEPDLDAATDLLRRLGKDPTFRHQLGANALMKAQRSLSLDAFERGLSPTFLALARREGRNPAQDGVSKIPCPSADRES